MSDDISRRAVLILVMIAVVVSILSTALVLNAIHDAGGFNSDQRQKETGNSPTARAVLYVSDPNASPLASGTTRLEVVNP